MDNLLKHCAASVLACKGNNGSFQKMLQSGVGEKEKGRVRKKKKVFLSNSSGDSNAPEHVKMHLPRRSLWKVNAKAKLF